MGLHGLVKGCTTSWGLQVQLEMVRANWSGTGHLGVARSSWCCTGQLGVTRANGGLHGPVGGSWGCMGKLEVARPVGVSQASRGWHGPGGVTPASWGLHGPIGVARASWGLNKTVGVARPIGGGTGRRETRGGLGDAPQPGSAWGCSGGSAGKEGSQVRQEQLELGPGRTLDPRSIPRRRPNVAPTPAPRHSPASPPATNPGTGFISALRGQDASRRAQGDPRHRVGTWGLAGSWCDGQRVVWSLPSP